jgi:dephospho-CoA kinase
MKERTFTSFEDYRNYLKQKMIHKAKKKGLEGTALEEFLKKHENDAARIWEEHNLQKSLAADGYVTIAVWRDEEGKRKIGRGRPKKSDCEKLKHSIHVRLDEETYKKLNQYCLKNNVDISEAIRILINNL